MPPKRERLSVNLFHLIKGEAEGRFAIVALFVVVIAVVILWRHF